MKERQHSIQLKKAILEAMPNVVYFKLADGFTSGLPDLSLSWFGVSSWWELKVTQNGKIVDRKVQHQTMMRLEQSGVVARYIIFDEEMGLSYVCLPSGLHAYRVVNRYTAPGGDYELLAGFVKNTHTWARKSHL